MRVGKGSRDFDSSNNNSLSPTHGLWPREAGRQLLASVSVSLHVPKHTHLHREPLSLRSNESPRSWPFLQRFIERWIKELAHLCPRSRRWEGYDSHPTLSMTWPLFSLPSSAIWHQWQDGILLPACACLHHTLFLALWRLMSLESPPRHHHRTKTKTTKKNTKSSSYRAHPLNHGWPTWWGGSLLLTLEMKLLFFSFLFHFCYLHRGACQGPQRSTYLNFNSSLFLDFSAVATKCQNVLVWISQEK